MANLYGDLVDIIAKHLDVAADRIHSRDSFHTLGLDSLSIMELWFEIENRWGIDKELLDNGMHQPFEELARRIEQQVRKPSFTE